MTSFLRRLLGGAFSLALFVLTIAGAGLVADPTPASAARGAQCGGASWYALDGRRTASGQIMNSSRMTAAHRYLPFGSRVTVRNVRNGRSVSVVINDRGPFVGGRIIDVSRGAARRLGFVGAGVASVCLSTGTAYASRGKRKKKVRTASHRRKYKARRYAQRKARRASTHKRRTYKRRRAASGKSRRHTRRTRVASYKARRHTRYRRSVKARKHRMSRRARIKAYRKWKARRAAAKTRRHQRRYKNVRQRRAAARRAAILRKKRTLRKQRRAARHVKRIRKSRRGAPNDA